MKRRTIITTVAATAMLLGLAPAAFAQDITL